MTKEPSDPKYRCGDQALTNIAELRTLIYKQSSVTLTNCIEKNPRIYNLALSAKHNAIETGWGLKR